MGHRPYFLVDDVVATATFYRDQLGFRYERFRDEPPGFTIVQRNGAYLMLRQLPCGGHMHPNRIDDPEDFAWNACLWGQDADTLYAEFQHKGVKIVRPICDQEYNCRDFDIEDCNGFRLCSARTSPPEKVIDSLVHLATASVISFILARHPSLIGMIQISY